MTEHSELHTIGWRERVDLPDWGFKGVRAKADTGARTSAIDVAYIKELPSGEIRFEVVQRHHPVRKTRWVTARPVRTSVVKPSHGKRQQRYVCRTRIRIGPHEREIEVSLVCRMLLGRTALAGMFVVDPERRYVLSKPGSKGSGRAEPRKEAS